MSDEKKVAPLLSNKKLIREFIEALNKEGFKEIKVDRIGRKSKAYKNNYHSWSDKGYRIHDVSIIAKWRGYELHFTSSARCDCKNVLHPAIRYEVKGGYTRRRSWKVKKIVSDSIILGNYEADRELERQKEKAVARKVFDIIKKGSYPILSDVQEEYGRVRVNGLASYIAVKELEGSVIFYVTLGDNKRWVKYQTLVLLARLADETKEIK